MIEPKLVVGYYKQTDSIRKTAIWCGCSEQKVRKILITQGIYCTPLVAQINDYYNKGYTVQEIANKLQISIKSVVALHTSCEKIAHKLQKIRLLKQL